jgi:hypothetical protein
MKKKDIPPELLETIERFDRTEWVSLRDKYEGASILAIQLDKAGYTVKDGKLVKNDEADKK